MSRAIIYCHLQHDIPRCFWTSLKKTRELWNGDIYLIAPQRELGYSALDEYNVKFVAQESIQSNLLNSYTINTFFDKIHVGWDGFWDNACKRFIYICEVQKKYGIDEFIHIETDVVPYIDIGEMFFNFKKAYDNKLVLSPHADYQLSCCTIYCNSASVMEHFCGEIIGYFKRGAGYFAEAYPSQTILNETHFAYQFQKENPEEVDLLPTVPGEKCSGEFGFVIDPTAWGMWVGGLHRDPDKPFATHNHYIGKLILDGKYTVAWDDKKRPYVAIGDNRFPLATLHFNSKRPENWI